MDTSYVREREVSTREKPNYVGEGIALGIRDFGIGIYKGIAGIIVKIFIFNKIE